MTNSAGRAATSLHSTHRNDSQRHLRSSRDGRFIFHTHTQNVRKVPAPLCLVGLAKMINLLRPSRTRTKTARPCDNWMERTEPFFRVGQPRTYTDMWNNHGIYYSAHRQGHKAATRAKKRAHGPSACCHCHRLIGYRSDDPHLHDNQLVRSRCGFGMYATNSRLPCCPCQRTFRW